VVIQLIAMALNRRGKCSRGYEDAGATSAARRGSHRADRPADGSREGFAKPPIQRALRPQFRAPGCFGEPGASAIRPVKASAAA
jgi:hypothetical protein